MTPIIELLETCSVEELETETIYKPIGSPPDRYVREQLDLCRIGTVCFYRALMRPGRPQIKGEV